MLRFGDVEVWDVYWELLANGYLIRENSTCITDTSAYALVCSHMSSILPCSPVCALPDICVPGTAAFYYRDYYAIIAQMVQVCFYNH